MNEKISAVKMAIMEAQGILEDLIRDAMDEDRETLQNADDQLQKVVDTLEAWEFMKPE